MPESRPKRRWYQVTPDRLIFGLLAVEVFLVLSERFQWFAFNEKKGWTVLIAVAAVCLVVVVMLVWLGASLLFRWRFQFSLRSLVVLVVAVAIPCCWFALKMRQAERQRQAVEAIREAGGWVYYGYECDVFLGDLDVFYGDVTEVESPAPTWLRALLGRDFFLNATLVEFALYGPEDSEGPMVYGGTETDVAGLNHLKELPHLKVLWLSGSKVTDSELVLLKELTELAWLKLSYLQATDAGLRNLTGLRRLKRLTLMDRDFADAGLESIKGLTGLERLDFSFCLGVTDAGLENLKGLTNLRYLDLSCTDTTNEGAMTLQATLPNCEIHTRDSWPNNPQDQ